MAPQKEEARPLLADTVEPTSTTKSVDDTAQKLQGPAPAASNLAVLAAFLFPAIGGLLFGFDIGGTSAVMSQLESSAYSGVDWYYYIADSTFLQGLITSIGIAGAMVGSMICFKVGDFLGRRKELLISALLYFLGGLLECQSGAFTTVAQASAALTMLIAGRITFGVACGFAMHGAPAYIAEMAPSSIRGLLISLKEAFIVVGILIGYVLGYVYDETAGGWRYVYGSSMLFAAAMFVGMLMLPPSSRWLVTRGRNEEAWASLKFITPGARQADFDELVRAFEESRAVAEASSKQGWEALTTGPCRLALIAGCGVVVLQQVTGQPSVLYYADSIFADVGLDSIASVLVGSFKLVATLYAVLTVDSQGRKKLLFIGVGMMLVGLLVLTVAYMFPYMSKGAILAAMFTYIGGYQVGFGPIAWLLISEVFPMELRGKAISVAVVVNFLVMTLMTFEFATEVDLIGESATFFLFAVVDASRSTSSTRMCLKPRDCLLNK
ncbi:unnamed protein product [Heterosigma akashiwo]